MGRFQNAFVSPEDFYSLGVDTVEGCHYAAFPVSSGIVDYEEYYRLTDEQYALFLGDREAALKFINSCRRQEKDELLLQKPGGNRGTTLPTPITAVIGNESND